MKTLYATAALALAISLVGCSSSNTDSMAASQSQRDASPNTLNNNPNYPNNPADVAAVPRTVNVLENTDRHFVDQAASGGAFEIQSSQLALSRSSDAGIKGIAQHLMDDHKKMGDQLTALAKDKGMDVNAIPNADQQKSLDKLNGLSGAAFDTEFLKQQDSAHQDTLLVFQQEERLGKDPDMRNFAGKNIPVLAAHLKMIQDRSMGNAVGSDNP